MAALIAVIISTLANAAPITNNPPLDPSPEIGPPFVPEPRGRGTFGIFSSCAITLTICVWTAVHPNIIKRDTLPQRLLNKATYVIVGIFSPEIILGVAFGEWRDANNVLKEARLAGAIAYANDEIELAQKAQSEGNFQGDKQEAGKCNGSVCQPALGAMRKALDAAINLVEARNAKANPDKATEDENQKISEATGTDEQAERAAEAKNQTTTVAAETTERAAEAEAHANAASNISRYSESDHEVWEAVQQKQKLALAAARVLRAARRVYEIAKKTEGKPWWRRNISIERFRVSRIGNFFWPEKASEYEFSRECSFFAVMGGYTIRPLGRYTMPDSYNETDEADPDHEHTIGPKGFIFLFRQQIITAKMLGSLKLEVSDKGNSDMLAKLVVCVQALWMTLNCLAREKEGLPITLLELNVSMHVICAITVYGFWWKKPHDAGRPISLSPFFNNSGISELIYMMDEQRPDLYASADARVAFPPKSEVNDQNEPPAMADENDRITEIATPDSDRSSFKITSRKPPPNAPGPSHPESRESEIVPGTREWKIGAVAAYEIQENRDKPFVLSGKGPWLHTLKVEMFTKPSRFKTGQSLVWILLPLCLIYAAFHASAWNKHFPTPKERLLWRVSCTIIGTPFLGPFALRFVQSMRPQKKSDMQDKMEQLAHDIKGRYTRRSQSSGSWKTVYAVVLLIVVVGVGFGSGHALMAVIRYPHNRLRPYLILLISMELFIFVTLCVIPIVVWFVTSSWWANWQRISVLAMIVYCAARAFIVLESFLCLRSLPAAAFETVSWGNVWPHL